MAACDSSKDGALPVGEDNEPIAQAIVDQAIRWYVSLSSGTPSSREREAFAAWRDAHPDHARAWRRLEHLAGRLRECSAQVEPETARAALVRLRDPGRRRLLKGLVWTGGGALAIYLSRDVLLTSAPLTRMLTDHRTAIGEQRELRLADGTQVLMNTATALDIREEPGRRAIRLHSGEICVTTAGASGGRPLRVVTRDGSLTPIGTRFSVRRIDAGPFSAGSTQVSVSEGVIEIRTADALAGDGETARSKELHAGQVTRFDRSHIDPPQALPDDALSWTQGMFTAQSQRLGEFVVALERYRVGLIHCDPAVADLRITGAWPLDGPEATDRILASLERHLPVRIRRRTRYWVVIVSAGAPPEG